ncbi:MAG: hypothetical protein HZC55_16945 [Verrucomicrobia bacterium]|nr:hypothetical protein [Verrucomicrobiota bacterium]
MMTDGEWHRFRQEMQALAEAAAAQGRDIPGHLEPHFFHAVHRHPDEEVELVEFWDQLISRRLL